MDTDRTRAALQAWMTALASRDREKMAALIAPDARVVWPTGAPLNGYSGRDEIVEAMATARAPRDLGLDPATFSAAPGRIVVDGSTAVVELAVTAQTTSGEPYENDYAFFYEFNADGLLIEMREYGDTLNAARQLPHVFAEAIEDLRSSS